MHKMVKAFYGRHECTSALDTTLSAGKHLSWRRFDRACYQHSRAQQLLPHIDVEAPRSHSPQIGYEPENAGIQGP